MGKEAAKAMHESDQCLEEYVGAAAVATPAEEATQPQTSITGVAGR